MKSILVTHSAVETQGLAEKMAGEIRPGTTLCLSGDLGAGKTTFAQGLLLALGADGPFTSPTFVIMKEYSLIMPVNSIKRVYHVDAYRVEEKDLASLGFAEWCADPEGIVILEWPERIKNILPPNAWHLTFAWKNDTEREISIRK